MAGRSSQADNRGTNFLGFLASGKGRQFHSFRDAKAIAQVGHTATGGVISDYNDGGTLYRSHIFTSSGEFSVTEASEAFGETVEFLLVAGGGAGGDNINGAHGGNGGGGGGGLVEGNALPVSSTTTFTVTIGAGGADSVKSAIPGSTGTPGPARNGANSTISGPTITTVTAKGGGGGGVDSHDSPGPGGSGGGSWGGGGAGPTTKGSATQPGTNSLYGATDYGFAGGISFPVADSYNGAGGGGAGGVGQDATNSNPGGNGGNGGAGRASTIAYGPTNPVTYAGGGAGGNSPYGGTGGTGGAGGGAGVGSFGEHATGGGGGGALAGTAERLAGGSGIAVFRYQIGSTSTAKATGGAISFYGGKTIHVFTSSGTFVNPGSISNAEIFMIGGGGSGGTNIAGGGGAGAVMSGSSLTMPANTYTITIGAGGVGRTSTGTLTSFPANDTTIVYPGPYTITAQRGGFGASYPSVSAQTGGSGGGGVTDQPTGAGTTKSDQTVPIGSFTSYGNAGGSGNSGYSGSGGGGAGGAGGDQPSGGVGGAGGVGMQIPTTFRDPRSAPSDSTSAPYQRGGGLGTPGPSPGGFYVAGGGGGAAYDGDVPGNRGLGGAGGGGDGAWHTNSPPNTDGQDAVQNTGSGGGGAGYSPGARSTGGSGGSGLVLIAYPT